MPQAPKFIITNDGGIIDWKLEAANGNITGTSGEETFGDKAWAEQSIREHIEAAVAASGVSVSIGIEFDPVIEYVGFEEPAPDPPLDGPFPEQTVEGGDEAEGESEG